MISQLLNSGHTGYLSYSATNLNQSRNAQVQCVVSGVLTTFTTNARCAGVMTLYQCMHCACAALMVRPHIAVLHPQPHPKQVLIIRVGLQDFSPGALKKIMSQSAQFIAVQPAPGPAVATADAPLGGLPGVAYSPTAQQGAVILQVSNMITINFASKKEEASIYSYT